VPKKFYEVQKMSWRLEKVKKMLIKHMWISNAQKTYIYRPPENALGGQQNLLQGASQEPGL
jgi:hypothetical protein